jgi:hypothetical protein
VTRAGPVSDRNAKPPRQRRRGVDLFGFRAVRNVIRPKELSLHMVVAKLLRDHCLDSWRWTHIPSGEHRDIRTASKLKQMGTQKGWPDFLLIDPFGYACCLELKREKQKLTAEQKAFSLWCGSHAVRFGIAHTIDDALRFLGRLNCLRINTSNLIMEDPNESR